MNIRIKLAANLAHPTIMNKHHVRSLSREVFNIYILDDYIYNHQVRQKLSLELIPL